MERMKIKQLFVVLIVFTMGYVTSVFLHPRLTSHRKWKEEFKMSEIESQNGIFSNILTGDTVRLMDELSLNKRNLLVFWSPTCDFCKRFFLRGLNNQIVGIHCFPLTNDMDYLNFYLKKNDISLPQYMLGDGRDYKPVEVKTIMATPTFVIVDDTGNVLSQFIGVNNLDKMIYDLYNGI